MIALYLIAAHFVGDFVLQTRWQSAGKAGWTIDAVGLRFTHVVTYTLPFIPIAVFFGHGYYADPYHTHSFFYRFTDAPTFIGALAVLHFLTDSRRFERTLGEVIAWPFLSAATRAQTHARVIAIKPTIPPKPIYSKPDDDYERKLRLPPNPWTPLPLLLDQTLHLAQLAVLGVIFLS